MACPFRQACRKGDLQAALSYPNNEDLQVWKGVLNTSDLDDVLLIRNVKIDAEGKLNEASLFDWLPSFPFRMRSWIPLRTR